MTLCRDSSADNLSLLGLCLLIGCFCELGTADACDSACKRYRLIHIRSDIGTFAELQLPPAVGNPTEGHSHFGLNDHSQVVGTYRTSSDAIHAWIWLPSSAHGLSAGFNDLHTATASAGNPTFSESGSAATDINNDGMVVGAAGSSIATSFVAWKWDLSGHPSTSGWHGSLHPASIDFWSPSPNTSTDTGSFSFAFAVNEADPPAAVGFIEVDYCESGEDPFLGFHVDIDSSPTMEPLNPDSQSIYSFALDVSTSSARAVGHDTRDDNATNCGLCEGPCVETEGCGSSPYDALAWLSPSTSPTPTAVDAHQSVARLRGVNDNGNMVGWYRVEQGSPPVCRRRAGYWNSTSASAVNLGTFLADSATSQAEAITTQVSGSVRVVGETISPSVGWYWQRIGTSGAWCGVDFDSICVDDVDLIGTGSQCDDFAIVQALAINAYGHVACVYQRDGETQNDAAVLTCSGDLNEDFRVSSTDRNILIAERTAGCTSGCKGDLDCDGDVDGDDLGFLLAQSSGTSPCTVPWVCHNGSGDSFSSPATVLEAALLQLDFSSIDAFVAWLQASDGANTEDTCISIAELMNAS